MFWKVLKDDKIVDLLQRLQFVKYQEKNDVILFCEPDIAEAVLSSDCNKCYHIKGLLRFKLDDTVYYIEEISETIYEKLNKQLEMEG